MYLGKWERRTYNVDTNCLFIRFAGACNLNRKLAFMLQSHGTKKIFNQNTNVVTHSFLLTCFQNRNRDNKLKTNFEIKLNRI